MPSSYWTWDPKAEGAGWGAQPGDERLEGKAETQEEGMFMLHILVNKILTTWYVQQNQYFFILMFLFFAALYRRWRRNSQGSSRSKKFSSKWVANQNALIPPPKAGFQNSTPSQTCRTLVYSLLFNLLQTKLQSNFFVTLPSSWWSYFLKC